MPLRIVRLLSLALLGITLATAGTAAHAEREIHWGGKIVVPMDSSLPDTVCLFCRIDAQGEVGGNLLVIFGSVRLYSNVHQDVISIFSRVRVEDGVSLDWDLVSVFSWIQLGDQATIGADLIAILDWLTLPDSVDVRGSRIRLPLWILLFPLALLSVYLVFASDERRASQRRSQARQQYVQSGRKPPVRRG